MGKDLSARELQSLRVRTALIDACADLLVKHPIDAITINNIVEHAGVAKGSFYNHFSDKEALASAVSDAILREVELAVRTCNENVTDPAYRIVRGMCTHIRLAVSEPRKATIMLRGQDWMTSQVQYLQQNVHADVSQGVKSGRFILRAENAGALVIIGTCHVSMIQILERSMSARDARKLATQAFSLILCGLGLDETEAVRIVGDSAAAIIRN